MYIEDGGLDILMCGAHSGSSQIALFNVQGEHVHQ